DPQRPFTLLATKGWESPLALTYEPPRAQLPGDAQESVSTGSVSLLLRPFRPGMRPAFPHTPLVSETTKIWPCALEPTYEPTAVQSPGEGQEIFWIASSNPLMLPREIRFAAPQWPAGTADALA